MTGIEDLECHVLSQILNIWINTLSTTIHHRQFSNLGNVHFRVSAWQTALLWGGIIRQVGCDQLCLHLI